MEQIISITIIMVVVMWAGLMMASFLGKMVSNLLPFENSSPVGNDIVKDGDGKYGEKYEELDLVA